MIYPDLELWLYGSNARGDIDPVSDFDVLAVTDQKITVEEIRGLIPKAPYAVKVSPYNWNEIEGMAQYGSLFLHHVRLEGRHLFSAGRKSGLSTILSALPPHQRVAVDVRAFRTSLEDVCQSLEEEGSICFELSVLATTLRHSAILGCYVSGFPTFGRSSAVQKIVANWHLDPKISALFPDLYAYRLSADQRIGQVPVPLTEKDAFDWCGRVGLVLDKLQEFANEYQRKLSKTSSFGY